MLFRKKETKNNNITKKQEIKKFTKEIPKNQANVIANFNQVVDIQNGFFITKNKEVTFVFQLENIDYNLLSKEDKFNTKKAYERFIDNFEKREGFTKDTLLNQYVFKVPYKLEKFEQDLTKLVNKTTDEDKLRILLEEQEQIFDINYNNSFNVLSTFITFSIPLKEIKRMYTKVNNEILKKFYNDYTRYMGDINIVDFKNEVEFIQLFLCNLYKNNMELLNLDLVNSNLNLETFLNLKENEIKEEMWHNLSMSKKLYSFLPNSIEFKSNYFVTNGSTYNGIINISKYQSSMNDCWGDNLYGAILEFNPYIDNVSLKFSLDKSECIYYQGVIAKEFLDAENEMLKIDEPDQTFKWKQKFLKTSLTERNRQIEARYNDFDHLNSYLKNGGLVMDTYLSIRFTSDSLENFKHGKKQILENLRRYGFNAMDFEFHQKKLFESYLCSSKSWLHTNEQIISYETLTNEVIPSFLSNTITTHLDKDKYASFVGLNDSNLPVTFSMFEKTDTRTNWSMFVTGASGYGKSSWIKSLIKKYQSKGAIQIVLDIEGEYVDLVKTFSNHLIFSKSNMTINPLIPFVDNISMHRVFLQEFFALLLKQDRQSREVILLCRVWTQLIEKNQNIILSDLVNEIHTIIGDEQFSYSNQEYLLSTEDLNILIQLKDKLELDIKNDVFARLFNTRTTLDVNKIKEASTVLFDLNEFKTISDHEYYHAYSYLLVKTIDQIIQKKDDVPTLLYVDEIHMYVKNNPYLLAWFNQCAGDLRKRNAGIVTATQNIKDITKAMSDTNNRKIVDDVTYKVYFNSDDETVEFLSRDFKELRKNYDLQERIKTLPKHNCIMFLGNKIIDLKVKHTEKDFKDYGTVGK